MKIFKKIEVLALCFIFAITTCTTFACAHKHRFSEDWTSDSTYHWHASTCGLNDEISDKELHSLINGTCSVCGYHTHIFDNNWSYDENYHWREAICAHNELKSDRAEHIFQHRKCIICSAEMPQVIDTQTILNGNFEFFDDSDDKTYIIYTPENWSESVSGRSNYVMNGILDTSKSGWSNFDDPAKLAQTLEDNAALDEDDPDYDELHKDYNGMREWDIPYADPQAALDDDATDEDKAVIANPETHDVITDTADGKTATFTDENGETVTLYKDDAGDYFFDENFNEPYESHVLMVHNYAIDDNNDGTHYGTAQSFSSASTITLAPNTAAEISVWVKTSDLKYGRSGATPKEELGAYIAVTQTMGVNTVDTFYIKGINTADLAESGNNNGWVQYTIFVQGCNFAETTFSVEVGLGLADDEGHFAETVEGYAFFDDITCTPYSTLSESIVYNTVSNRGYITNSENKKLDTICEFSSNDNTEFCYDDFKNNKDFINGFGRHFLIKL